MSLLCLEPIRLSVSVELTAQVITSLKALFRLHLAPTHYFSNIPYLTLAPWVPAIPVSLFSPTWQRNTCLTHLQEKHLPDTFALTLFSVWNALSTEAFPD